MTGQRHVPKPSFVPVDDPCPTPEKRIYYTRKQAKDAHKQVRHKSSSDLSVYRCGQHFHLGTRPEWFDSRDNLRAIGERRLAP